MENKRTEIKINKLLGIKDGTFYFVDGVFQYETEGQPITFKGATFSYMEGLTEEQMYEKIRDYDRKELRQMAVADNLTEYSLDEWTDDMSEEEKQNIVRDDSYESEYLEQMQAINTEIVYTDCVGGGRSRDPEMINADYRDSNFDAELAKMVQDAETK